MPRCRAACRPALSITNYTTAGWSSRIGTRRHTVARTHILARLFIHAEEGGSGRAYGRVGVVLRRDPDSLLAPDTAFVPNEQLPTRTSPEDFLLTIPALVVEILDRCDTQPEIAEKVNAYLAAGVVVVWVADPDARTVRTAPVSNRWCSARPTPSTPTA